MATLNPFDLIGDDDSEDPAQLIAAAQKVVAPTAAAAAGPSRATPAGKGGLAELPSNPLPPKHAGMENIDNEHFLSWIKGKGPFVPQPLPADTSVPELVVVSDWCHGLTREMFEKGNRESVSSAPSPLFAPVDLLPVLNNDDYSSTQCNEMSYRPIVYLGSETRFYNAFKRLFIDRSGCNNSMEKGTCIWSDGTHSWSDKSCGIMWVAVHGTDSICVVTRNEDLEQEMAQCRPGFECRPDFEMTKKELLDIFMQGIIYKVEDLAVQMFDQSLKKPFGVVSVIPGTHKGSGHEVSNAEYDEEKTIMFLEDEMKSNASFTFNKTVQTAISAFQHLFRQKFKANEIRVIVWKEDGDVVKELPSRDDRSIEEQMSVMDRSYL